MTMVLSIKNLTTRHCLLVVVQIMLVLLALSALVAVVILSSIVLVMRRAFTESSLRKVSSITALSSIPSARTDAQTEGFDWNIVAA